MKPVIFFGWEFLPAGSFRANILCFCWGSRGAECCAWLYFSHFTGTGWSSVSSVSAVSSMYRPLSLSHLERETTRSSWEMIRWRGWARRGKREKQSEMVRLVGLDVDGSVPNALSAVDCDPRLQIFLPTWDLRFNQLLNPQRDRVSVQHPLVITMKNTG